MMGFCGCSGISRTVCKQSAPCCRQTTAPTPGNLDVSNNVRKFYGQYNNIRTVLGYGTHEMSVVHLCKVYCLSALMYGCESWHLQNKEQSRISVAWNNCIRSIFNCCWRESVNSLQYFCKVLPINYLIHQRKLLY